MSRIFVQKIAGAWCITSEDAEDVFHAVMALRAQNDKTPIILDFALVQACAPPFFNTLIGASIAFVPIDEIDRFWTVENLNSLGTLVFRRVLANAKQYLEIPAVREAVDELDKDRDKL